LETEKNVEAAKSGISRGVPIEIQLRITNLSKRDLAFPTFDTYRLAVLGPMVKGSGRAAVVPSLLSWSNSTTCGHFLFLGTEGAPPAWGAERSFCG